MENAKATIGSLFELHPTKSQRTKLLIIEAAIESYISVGVENATFDIIAKNCDLSRPLVQKYFPEKTELFELAIKLIRTNMQQLATEFMKETNEPKAVLRNYVRSTFEWVKRYPSHARVWLLFYYYCSFKEDYKDLNSELVNVGHKRIIEILTVGLSEKKFRVRNIENTAKLIQTVITGALLEILTEKLFCDLEVFQKNICEEVLKMAGA